MDIVVDRLLRAIAAPPDRGGLAVAVSMTLEFLRAAESLYPSPRLTRIRMAAQEMLPTLNGEVDADPRLKVVSDRERRTPVYGFFVDPPKLVGPVDQLAQLRALAGCAIALAVSRNEQLPKVYAEGLRKLARAYMKRPGLHADWHSAAAALPLGERDIEKALETCSSEGVRSFLAACKELGKLALVPFLDAETVPIKADLRQPAERTDEGPEPAADEPTFRFQEGNRASALAVSEFDPLQWQLRRAEYARFPDTVGLPVFYGRMPMLALGRVGSGLARALEDGGSRADQALFAVLGLALALPPEHVGSITVGTAGSLSLDPRGYVRWDMGSVIGGGENPVLVPLPVLAVEVLHRAMAERPSAICVDQLCGVPLAAAERRVWLKAFDAFLKSLSDPAYPAWPSRFAYSLGQACLDVCGQDILAAACTLTFSLIPIASLHYTWLPAETIADTAARMYGAIGLGEVVCLPDDYSGAGARDVPTRADFKAGWDVLVAGSVEQLRALEAAGTPDALTSAWDGLCESNALMFCLQTGHRGQRMERCTLGAMLASDDYVFLSDKDTNDGGSARLLPKTEPLARVLQWHRHCLGVLTRQVRLLCGGDERISEFARCGLPFTKAAFFALTWWASELRLSRRPIPTARLTNLAKDLFHAKANVGRKFWVTELVRRGADRWLIRLLTFHRRQGAEPDHHVQVQVLDRSLDALKCIMEEAMRDLDLRMPEAPTVGSPLKLASYPLPGPVKESVEADAEPWARSARLQGLSLSAVRLIDSVRRTLVQHRPPLQPRASLALFALAFDGITSEDVLKELVLRTRESAVLQGRIVAAKCNRGRRVVIHPLQGPTCALIPDVLAVKESGSWADVTRDVARWLAAQFPEFAWGPSTMPWTQLVASMGHWLHLRVPSLLNTAAERAGEIAVLSEASCARLGGAQTAAEGELRPPRPHSPVRVRHWTITELSRPVHRWGDTRQPFGANVARAAGLRKDLEAIPLGSPGSPFAACRIWISTEVERVLSRASGTNEISSTSTYLSYLSAPLMALSPLEDLRSWDDDQWSELLLQVRQLAPVRAGEDAEQRGKDREPAFHRFARALAEDGSYRIPDRVLLGHRREAERGALRPASSVWVGEQHRTRAVVILKDWLRDEPWKLRQCLLLLDLTHELPLRIAEPLAVTCDALLSVSPHLALSPTGFSHLKTSTSIRLIEMTKQLADDCRSTAVIATQLNFDGAHLFLPAGNSMDEAAEIVDLVHVALQEAVGDPALAMHSLRGSSIARTLCPGWEDVATGALQLQTGPRAASRFFDYDPKKWLLAADAASRAGHSERDRLVHDYFAVWAQLRYVALASTLQELRLGTDLLVAANVTPAALRQARCRHAADAGALDEWTWWQLRLPTPELETLAPNTAATAGRPSETAIANASQGPDAASKIRYVVKRYLGVDEELAAASEHIPKRHCALLGAAVGRMQAIQGLTDRVRFSGARRARRADLACLSGQEATSWLRSCDGASERDVAALNSLLLRTSEADWSAPLQAEATVAQATSALPAGLTLEFTFGAKHHKGDVEGLLRALNVRVNRPHRDYGVHPRVFVVRGEGSRNDVEKARLTAMMRLLTTAFCCMEGALRAAGNG